MAEFATVMHEMQRMCKAFIDANECQNCPLINNPVCGSPVDMDGKDIAKAEADTMAWAAKHPEPKYPTWGAWLTEKYGWNNAYGTPIPADIAEKLGIEPK